jgi:hypothetical protein
MHDVRTLSPDYPGKLAYAERIRNWRMVQTTTGVNPR